MSHAAEPYTADAELTALLAAARETGERIRIKAGEKTYEVEVKSAIGWVNPYAGYTEEEIAEALQAAAGMFTEEEADRIIKMIYEARELGTQPIDRPRSSPVADASEGVFN